MRYCLNPDCPQPQNSDDLLVCRACGTALCLQDRYSAIQLIGQGGFGRTFLAIDANGGTDERLEKTRDRSQAPISPSSHQPQSLCVIKQLLVRDAMAIALFQQEAQRLQELGSHPQIPAFFDFFQQEQSLYLVQEFIPGQNLEELLQEQGTLTPAQIWDVLAQLLPVLKYIHDRKVIHRDIKPANIIRKFLYPPIAREDAIHRRDLILVDFGAAKVIHPLDLVQTGTSIGSAEYVAPEQARGKATFASDLYSLGVTCIHLLTNVPPFDLFDSVNDRWAWREFLPIQEQDGSGSGICDRLGDILDRLLHHALSQRFASADQVIERMQENGHCYQSSANHHPDSADLTAITSFSTPAILPPTIPAPIWTCLHTLTRHSASVHTVAISPDGQLLASGGYDKTIRLWNLCTGEEILTLLGHSQPVRSVAFSPDGNLLASASDDGTIRLWKLGTTHEGVYGYSVLCGHTQAVKAIAFSPTGTVIASASWDKTVKLWDCQTGKELLTLTGHKLHVTAIAFSADGDWLASSSADRTIRLWQVQLTEVPCQATLRHTLTGHVGAVLTVAFSPNSQLLATAGDDRTIKLWSVETGELIRTLSGHSWSVVTLAFRPTGNTLISGSLDTQIKLWQLDSDASSPAVIELTGHSDSIHAIAVSPDGNAIASGSRDDTIRVWKRNYNDFQLSKPQH